VIKRLQYRIAALKAYEALGEERARQGQFAHLWPRKRAESLRRTLQGLLDKNVMDQKKRDEEEFSPR